MRIPCTPRILLVDNNPSDIEKWSKRLEDAGYSVEAVSGSGADLVQNVIKRAPRFRPHVAVVDLRTTGAPDMDSTNIDDESGLKFAEVLTQAKLILFSAYLEVDLTSTAQERGFFAWVKKGESPEVLLRQVERAAREECACHKGFELDDFPSGWNSQEIVDILFKDKNDKPPPDILADVLVRLFSKAKGVRLTMIDKAAVTPARASRGHAVFFQAWPGGKKEPLFLKLAPSENISKEVNNFEEHVKGNVRGNFYANLEGYASFWDLGALLFRFHSTDEGIPPHFATFYVREQDPEKIIVPLRHFFERVWGNHYRDQTELKTSLFRAYDQTLGIQERLIKFPNQERYRAFPGIRMSLLNPVSWTLRHIDDSEIPNSYQAITHGDLHGDNLFVDGIHAWPIDFERTGLGPILRDFAELEVDILTRLIDFPTNDLSQLYELAIVLTQPNAPKTPLLYAPRLEEDPVLEKTFAVVSQLRALMEQLTLYQDFREYLWSLLFDALFVAVLVPETAKQRERSLLLASVICGRLRNWDRDWPSTDYPSTLGGSATLLPGQPQPFATKEEKGNSKMLSPEQQTALMVLSEATKFLFGELGRRLDFWRQKKGNKPPQEIDLMSGPTPVMRLDDMQQLVNLAVLDRTRESIATSLDILKKLTREKDGHRKELMTNTLIEPPRRVWLENRIPEIDQNIDEEATHLQALLDRVYTK